MDVFNIHDYYDKKLIKKIDNVEMVQCKSGLARFTCTIKYLYETIEGDIEDTITKDFDLVHIGDVGISTYLSMEESGWNNYITSLFTKGKEDTCIIGSAINSQTENPSILLVCGKNKQSLFE